MTMPEWNWFIRQEFDGPSLVLSFYYHQLDDSAAFSRLFNALTSLGARFAGHASICQGDNIRTKFSTLNSLLGHGTQRVKLEMTTEELNSLFDSSDTLVLAIDMHDAVGLTPNHEPEIMQYRGIDVEAMLTDKHPITISTAGESVNNEISETVRKNV